MTQIGEAFVRVRAVADTRSFERESERVLKSNARLRTGIRDTEREFSRFSRGALVGTGALGGLGRAAAFASTSFIGGAGIIFALKSTVAAAQESQAVLAQVQQAVENTGRSWEQYSQRIQDAASETSRLSGFDDERLLATFATLLRRTNDVNKAFELNALAANVARGRNIELEQATQLVLKASIGQVGALRRLGIDLKAGATATDALRLLNEKYAGSAARFADTAAGAQARFNVALQNMQEVIGTALLPSLTKYLSQAADWLDDTENQERVQRAVNSAVSAASGLLQTASGILRTFKTIVEDVDRVTGSFKNTLELLLAVGIARKLTNLAGGFTLVGREATKATGRAAAGGGGVAGLGFALRGLPATIATTVAIELLINRDPIEDFFQKHTGERDPVAAFLKKIHFLGSGRGGPETPLGTDIPSAFPTDIANVIAGGTPAGQGGFDFIVDLVAQQDADARAARDAASRKAAQEAAKRARLFVSRDDRTATELARAQAQGTKRQIIAAANARLAFIKDVEAFAKNLLAQGRGNATELNETLQRLYGDEASTQGIIDQINEDAARARKDRADKAKARAATQARLERESLAEAKARGKAFIDAFKARVQQRAQEVTDLRLLAIQDAQAAAQAITDPQKRLAAERKADRALIEYYRARAHNLNVSKVERRQALTDMRTAQRALNDLNTQARADARTAAAEAKEQEFQIGQQILQNAFLQAELIPNEKKRIAQEKTIQGVIVESLRKRAKQLGLDTLAGQQAQADYLNALRAYRELGKKDKKDKATGSFTLQELFAEASSEFARYGSNIGGADTPLSAQGARRSFGGMVGTAKTQQTVVVQNFWGERGTAQAMNDARSAARNLK